MVRWKSHVSASPSLCPGHICCPAHPSWHPLDRDCAKGFCLPDKRGEKHRAELVQKKHPQIPGMEKTCRVTNPSLPPGPSVLREKRLETHKCWQGAMEGDGITATAALLAFLVWRFFLAHGWFSRERCLYNHRGEISRLYSKAQDT